jgi:hypothetical protein
MIGLIDDNSPRGLHIYESHGQTRLGLGLGLMLGIMNDWID